MLGVAVMVSIPSLYCIMFGLGVFWGEGADVKLLYRSSRRRFSIQEWTAS